MAIDTKFTEAEMEASLKRAFVDGKADFIEMDGHAYRNRFLTATLDYALKQNLVYRDKDLNEDDALGKGMGQWSAETYRLTEKGKKHFRIR